LNNVVTLKSGLAESQFHSVAVKLQTRTLHRTSWIKN